jgi:hypothetical protein
VTDFCDHWYMGVITAVGIVKFGKGVRDESTKPEYESEDKPDPRMVDSLKIFVGTTFREVTSDPTEDVLLEVVAMV